MAERLTLYDKIWNAHVAQQFADGSALIYIDRHLVHEVTSPQAFDGLRLSGRTVRRPDLTLAVADHNLPTTPRVTPRGQRIPIADKESAAQVAALETNCEDYGIRYIPTTSADQGIVHVVGPEQGFTLPGTTIVCGDSHTAAHGALGALAFGIGTSEVEHVFATQTLIMRKSRNMAVELEGRLGSGVRPKDVVLAIIERIGAGGATGHVIEYRGDTFANMSVEGRLTVANMSIEAGARSGLFAPDNKTFAYLENRPLSPRGAAWTGAVDRWRALRTDEGAHFDAVIGFKAEDIAPNVTWGVSPQDVAPVTGRVPSVNQFDDPVRRKAAREALAYMGLSEGQRIEDIPIEHVFIGSCTNSRIEDLRDAASFLKGRRIAAGIKTARVVPGSGNVRRQAEEEGLDRIFLEAGFEWREPGCSSCLGMNPDKIPANEHCASTSNRNFIGRQGEGARTHLMSPLMAAAAALAGRIADARSLDR